MRRVPPIAVRGPVRRQRGWSPGGHQVVDRPVAKREAQQGPEERKRRYSREEKRATAVPSQNCQRTAGEQAEHLADATDHSKARVKRVLDDRPFGSAELA